MSVKYGETENKKRAHNAYTTRQDEKEDAVLTLNFKTIRIKIRNCRVFLLRNSYNS